MTKKDYYEILGIDKSADEATIKRAYRNMAMKYHPDRNPGDAQAIEKMKEINEAYAVLSDRHKRQLYDTYGHAGLEGYTATDIFGSVDFLSLFREFGLSYFGFSDSIFDGLFGAGRTSTKRQRKASDIRYDLEVTLEEVALGAEKKIRVPRTLVCFSCLGTGASERGLEDCDHCGGSGQIVREQRSGFTVIRQILTCSRCHGRGKIIKEPCIECQGQGFVREVRELTISIPRGADTGYTIKIEGEGEAGDNGVIPGDLYVVLNIRKHPIFERRGDDIYLTREISFVQAALGDEINDIPSLYGTLKLKIPEGTQTGTVFKIKGKGIPHLDSHGNGDLYVMVKVVTPKNLTQREKELLREFERLQKQRTRAN